MNDTPHPEKQATKTDLQGAVADLTDSEHRRKAVDLAFDYRGDVTVETADGRSIQGYIYDRAHDADHPYIRMMPGDGSPRVKIELDQLVRLTFSGKDTAAGQSWETWMKKWKEKKLQELAEKRS